MASTSIEWATDVWNPVTGCTKVSQGCKHCYAERVAERFWKGRKFTDVQCHEDRLTQPLRWKKPRRIFVNSMSDLFHEAVETEFIFRVLAVMALSARHTFIVLTKRPARMRSVMRLADYPHDWSEAISAAAYRAFGEEAESRVANAINGVLGDGHNVGWPMRNLWLGASVEDQRTADERIPLLLEFPAKKRIISYEPALGPIVIGDAVKKVRDLAVFANERIHWIICGGESGPGARPMHPHWARSVRDQCQAAGVPFFFKQWGEWAPEDDAWSCTADADAKMAEQASSRRRFETAIVLPNGGRFPLETNPIEQYRCNAENMGGNYMRRVGKHAAGRLLDGLEWNEYPEAKP